jgi:predicted AAA+ superfamily ATPase
MDNECTERLRQYFFTGGMPEAVSVWMQTHNPKSVRMIHQEILGAYYMDFAKHTKTMVRHIRMVWDSIPAQLAKENKKFIFGMVKKGARAAQFEEALQWLVDAGLVIRVDRCKIPRRPLKFYMDSSAFKIYLLDCGLLATLCETEPADILLGSKAFVEFKGAFAENFVLQQMTAKQKSPVYYYNKDNSTQEVDFLVQTPERIIPVEVKAEENVKSKSLSVFVNEDFKELEFKGLRCSMKPYVDQGWMENIPLYAVEAYFG